VRARLSALLRGLVRRGAFEREMDEEMRFHIERRTEDLVRSGMEPAAAARKARLEFGAVEAHQEECREARGLSPFDDARGDVRFAIRAYRRSPAFTLTAVATLALGIGAITAIFSVTKAVLLSELPYGEAGRIVALGESDDGGTRAETIGYATAIDWKRLSRSFRSLSLYRDASAAYVERDSTQFLAGLRVGHDFFDTLGIRMQLGRSFLPEEDRPDTRFEVVLAHALWVRSFGGDPSVIGRQIRLNEKTFTVVGVLPSSFRSLEIPGASGTPEFFAPLGYALSDPFACRSCEHLHLIGRLQPGVSGKQALAELNALMSELARRYPQDYPQNARAALEPLKEYVVGPVAAAIWVLTAAVALLLLMACVNVASLLLARAAGREREIALRAALGAARGRLIRQLLTESLVLAAAGGALGLLLGMAGVSALAALAPRELPRVGEIRLDAGAALFCFLASLATGVLFGLAPAWRASRPSLEEALRQSGKSTADKVRGRLRGVLAGAQIALAFVLLVGAALLGRSLRRLVDVDPGFDAQRLLTLKTFVYGKRYADQPQTELAYYDELLSRLRATPGVESAAITSALPIVDFDRYGFHIHDRPLPRATDAPSIDHYSVSPDYFRVMRIPVKKGRSFRPEDDARATRVAVVSETCARELFSGRDPIGKEIQLGARDETKPWITVVGVVGDIRQTGLGSEPRAAVYIPMEQNTGFSFALVVRATGEAGALEPAVRAVFRDVDPTLPVYQVRSMEDVLAASLSTRRFTLTLLSLFGALALTLAAVGIYGVFACSVAARTREIGIRMALGAERGAVLGEVLKRASALALFGLAAGLAASLALTRLLSSLLFGITATDPLTLASVAGALALVALGASFVPARRAASVDPALTLRAE
jgi:putative ABC transport system permease protein